MAALLLGLAAFVLQGAALCGDAHAAPVVQEASHCAQMEAATAAHHAAGDADQRDDDGRKPATHRHACASACHPPAVAPSLPLAVPDAAPATDHAERLLSGLSGLAPPPATPPPRRG